MLLSRRRRQTVEALVAGNPRPPDSISISSTILLVCCTHHGTSNATKSYWLEDSERSDVSQFDAGFFNIQPSEANAMDPQQRLLMEVVYDGLCAAGQPMEKLRGTDTAVYVRPCATTTTPLSINTACSSTLVALDHAVHTVRRSGRSKVAVAAGTSLILSPAMYFSESNFGMLSPKGRCAMWDVAADGYARGEGVAAVIIKTLSQALADNNPIDCIIRATAGDPQEAEAIAKAQFPAGPYASMSSPKLHVGSVKTVIGHTEGTAGLAGLITTSLALKHASIPPNLHFNDVSPKVAPIFKHLEIPTARVPWPPSESETRRAGVNTDTKPPCGVLFTPFTFSAASTVALRTMLSWYLEYLKANPDIGLTEFAYTLQHKRSTLLYRKAIAAPDLQTATQSLRNVLERPSNGEEDVDFGTRFNTPTQPSVIGIFTGQGAH
ncbi:MAG: hypothetical protein Q9202_007392 [Teloschistes flavicans]